MDSGGVLRAEIRILGKLTSQKIRTQIFRAETMMKSEQLPQERIDKGVAQCIQKSEVLAVVVKIQYMETELANSEIKYTIEEELTKLTKEDKKTINQLDMKTKEQ